MFREELEELVVQEMPNCIGCNECMRVCPVSKDPRMTISMLNDPILTKTQPKGIVREFALNCIQCGECVPVCPPGVRRDLMVLYLRANLSSYPSNYENYVMLKQPNPSSIAKGLYAVKRRSAKKNLGNLFDKCDPKVLKKAKVLFYPGCYIFNEICHKTTAILDYLKEDYEVLGGYTSCCGWPQYLQGRMKMADDFMESLYNYIKQVQPEYIITTCAECYAALRKIKAMKNASFIPLTTTEYFLSKADSLPLIKSEKKYGFHDSCHISRKYFRDEAPRILLSKLGEIYELKDNREQSSCCHYYNFENDPINYANRKERIDQVKLGSEAMLTDCITCYEVFKEKMEKENLEIVDFNDLIFECINTKAHDENQSE